MGWPSLLAVYFVVWWTVLFVVLPLDVERQREDETTLGTDQGAPAAPRLVKKAFVTTAISAILMVLGVAIVRYFDLSLESFIIRR